MRANGSVARADDGLHRGTVTFVCPDWSPPDGFVARCFVMCDRGVTGEIPLFLLTVEGAE